MTEQELRDQIKEAQAANDFEQVRELMKELIEMQDKVDTIKLTDDELADKGVDMAILTKERELRDQIKEANQNGDFVKVNELSRELIKLQKLQPAHVGIKIGG